VNIFKVLDCLMRVAGEWGLWVYLALWYSVVVSLWPWGDFSFTRASAFTVDVHSALVLAKC